MTYKLPIVFALALAANPAAAEVVQSSPAGFEVRHSVTVAAPPERAWPTVLAPRLWWSKDHTYSDDSANLTLDERPGGCFCEKLAGRGGVEHMRVVYIQPPRMIRLRGGLGPLQAEAADGTLAITLTAEGGGTRIGLSYVVGGYIRSGAEKLAPMVDRVLGLQVAGLKAAIDGTATPAAGPPRIRAEPLGDVGEIISNLGAEPPPQPEPTPIPATPSRPRTADQDSPR